MDISLKKLTERTQRTVQKNLKNYISALSESNYDDPQYLARLSKIANNPSEFAGHGGFSFSSKELRRVYENSESKTYRQVVDIYTHEGMDAIFNNKTEVAEAQNAIRTLQETLESKVIPLISALN